MNTAALLLVLQFVAAAPAPQYVGPITGITYPGIPALPKAPKSVGAGNPRATSSLPGWFDSKSTSSPSSVPAGLQFDPPGLTFDNKPRPPPPPPPSQPPPPATPGDCKVIAGDNQWPAREAWQSAIPQVAVRGNMNNGQSSPDYKLLASTVQEVQAAVKFASDNNIRLSIVNSGHDFLGRNDAPNGLRINTADVKGIRLSKSFTPTANGVRPVDNRSTAEKLDFAPNEMAYVTFGVGMSTQLINNAIAPSKLFTLGAAHGEVSVAGGWGQTAGHSPLGPSYGLGADTVVEYKVVTADAKLTVANEVANPDLFWALRGGGGGTFGVVVEATVRAFPSPKMALTTWFLNTTDYNDKKSIYKAAAYFHSQVPDLVDNGGVSGYYYLYPNAIKSVFLTSGEKANVDYAKRIWLPVLDRMASMPGMNNKTLVAKFDTMPSYKAFFDNAFGAIDAPLNKPGMGGSTGIAGAGLGGAEPKSSEQPCTPMKRDIPLYRQFFEEAGLVRRQSFGENDSPYGKTCNTPKTSSSGTASNNKRHSPEEKMQAEIMPMGIVPMDSRLLGHDHLQDPSLADALEKAMPDIPLGQLRGNVVSGGKVWTAGDERTTSVHPAWRRSYIHLIATGNGVPNVDSLRAIAPDSGAYANEASRSQGAFKTAFWGDNYPRLSAIKTKYDPHGVFWVSPGINADEWVVKGNRLCRAPKGQLAAAIVGSEVAPESDNRNMAAQGDSNADGPGFPLLMVDGQVVEAPKGGRGNAEPH